MAQVVYPQTTIYATLQKTVDLGRGVAASIVGQPGNVYRLLPGVSGAFIQSATEVLVNFPLMRKVIKGGAAMEAHEGISTVYFNLICDLRQLETGDVYILNDPYYGTGANLVDYPTQEFVGVCVVHHSVMKPSYGMQLNRLATIWRPETQPDGTGYFQSAALAGQPMNIVNGQAVWGPVGGTPDYLPIGLAPVTRPIKPEQFRPGLAGMTEHVDYFCFVPPIEGYHPKEGDYIMTLDDSRYIVQTPWFLEAGIVGNSMIIRRVTSEQ